MNTTVIQQFPSKSEAFDWVTSKMLDCTIGNMTTTKQYNGCDAIIGLCDEIMYVGLFNITQL